MIDLNKIAAQAAKKATPTRGSQGPDGATLQSILALLQVLMLTLTPAPLAGATDLNVNAIATSDGAKSITGGFFISDTRYAADRENRVSKGRNIARIIARFLWEKSIHHRDHGLPPYRFNVQTLAMELFDLSPKEVHELFSNCTHVFTQDGQIKGKRNNVDRDIGRKGYARIRRTLQSCRGLLAEAGLQVNEIDTVNVQQLFESEEAPYDTAWKRRFEGVCFELAVI